MGCHTWFYSAANKAEWSKKFHESEISTLESILSNYQTSLENIDDEEYIKAKYVDRFYKHFIDNSKNFLRTYDMYKDKASILEEWDKQLKQEDNSTTLEKELEIAHQHTEYSMKDYLLYMIEYYKKELDRTVKMSDDEYIQEQHSNNSDGILWINYNGKLYLEIDSESEDLCTGEMKKVFKGESYHDVFRIYDYDAEPCFSLKETYKRIKEYNAERPKELQCVLTKCQDVKLKRFWKRFPDGMIEFG